MDITINVTGYWNALIFLVVFAFFFNKRSIHLTAIISEQTKSVYLHTPTRKPWTVLRSLCAIFVFLSSFLGSYCLSLSPIVYITNFKTINQLYSFERIKKKLIFLQLINLVREFLCVFLMCKMNWYFLRNNNECGTLTINYLLYECSRASNIIYIICFYYICIKWLLNSNNIIYGQRIICA